MTYTVGGLIQATDYNGFVSTEASNVNGIWGAGATTFGYGQSNLSTVSANAVISATNWASLVNVLSDMSAHQGTTITSRTAPVAGNTISILANVAADITTLTTNRGNASASGTDITANGTTSTTTIWSISATNTQTVTFANAASARYFFNAGGMIRLSWNLANGTTTNATEWSDLFTKSGTIAFTGGAANQTIAGTTYTGTTKVGGSGVVDTLASTTGFYDLTPGAGATTLFKQFADTAPYTTNYIQLTASLAANSTQLTFITSLVDPASNQGVDGNLSQTMTVRPPSTTYLTNSWGTPVMSSTSWTLSSGSAPTFVAVANNRVASTTVLPINKPTGTTTGDIMVAWVGTSNTGNERTWTGPSDWTEIYDEATTELNGPDLAVFYKIANASEGANYSFFCSGSENLGGAIATYRGAAYGGFYWGGYVNANNNYEVGGSTLVPNTVVVGGIFVAENNRAASITGYANVLIYTANGPSHSILSRTYANVTSNTSANINFPAGSPNAADSIFVPLIPTA